MEKSQFHSSRPIYSVSALKIDNLKLVIPNFHQQNGFTINVYRLRESGKKKQHASLKTG